MATLTSNERLFSEVIHSLSQHKREAVGRCAVCNHKKPELINGVCASCTQSLTRVITRGTTSIVQPVKRQDMDCQFYIRESTLKQRPTQKEIKNTLQILKDFDIEVIYVPAFSTISELLKWQRAMILN